MASFLLGFFLLAWAAPTQAQDKKKIDESVKPGEVFRVAGHLTKDDLKDRLRQDCHFQVYLFHMVPGHKYTLDMQSKDFDSFLRLEGSTGDPLAQDDDGGGNLHARIIVQPQREDTYRVVVTTFSPGATGGFLLTIRQEDAPLKKAK